MRKWVLANLIPRTIPLCKGLITWLWVWILSILFSYLFFHCIFNILLICSFFNCIFPFLFLIIFNISFFIHSLFSFIPLLSIPLFFPSFLFFFFVNQQFVVFVIKKKWKESKPNVSSKILLSVMTSNITSKRIICSTSTRIVDTHLYRVRNHDPDNEMTSVVEPEAFWDQWYSSLRLNQNDKSGQTVYLAGILLRDFNCIFWQLSLRNLRSYFSFVLYCLLCTFAVFSTNKCV